jgi:hypothetical protein
VASIANEEGLVIGSSDINLQIRLRRKVVPNFYRDVGDVVWRRTDTTLPVSANDREYDLPSDFDEIIGVPRGNFSASSYFDLTYIGEDALAKAAATANVTPGTPAGYWIKRATSAPKSMRVLYLDCLPDTAFTLYYSYRTLIYFADDTTPVDFEDYVPNKYQWALVEGLKLEIYRSRLKIDDPRLIECKEAYAKIVEDAIEDSEPAPRRKLARMRMAPMPS